MQETHVLGTAYRKTIHAEMTDHFRYALERLAELAQDVGVQLLVLLDAHVHKAASASATIKRARLREYPVSTGQSASFNKCICAIEQSRTNRKYNFCTRHLLQRQRIVLFSRLAVPHQVTSLSQKSQDSLCLDSRDGAVIPPETRKKVVVRGSRKCGRANCENISAKMSREKCRRKIQR